MVAIEEYPIRWKRPSIDLEKLAYLREVEGWTLKQLGEWAERSPITIGQILKGLPASSKESRR